MTTLQIRHVKKSKKGFHCDDCEKYFPEGTAYVYRYGMAHRREKPYAIKYCMRCENYPHDTLKQSNHF